MSEPMSEPMRPQFKHDCNQCVLLATKEGEDVYSCKNAVGGLTVIRRRGDDGGDYASMPYAVWRAAWQGQGSEWDALFELAQRRNT